MKQLLGGSSGPCRTILLALGYETLVSNACALRLFMDHGEHFTHTIHRAIPSYSFYLRAIDRVAIAKVFKQRGTKGRTRATPARVSSHSGKWILATSLSNGRMQVNIYGHDDSLDTTEVTTLGCATFNNTQELRPIAYTSGDEQSAECLDPRSDHGWWDEIISVNHVSCSRTKATDNENGNFDTHHAVQQVQSTEFLLTLIGCDEGVAVYAAERYQTPSDNAPTWNSHDYDNTDCRTDDVTVQCWNDSVITAQTPYAVNNRNFMKIGVDETNLYIPPTTDRLHCDVRVRPAHAT